MTIRFAPARNRKWYVPTHTRKASRSIPLLPANDNALEAANDDALLTEALRHFAEHGLCAAERARDKACDAHKAGDGETFDWWLSVCRMLDRRMADAIVARTSLAT